MPAAAVIRRMRALSGFIGFKGSVDGFLSQLSNVWAQPLLSVETVRLECGVGTWNSWCSGEMHRYHEELRLRRQLAILRLTLKHEGVGIKQD